VKNYVVLSNKLSYFILQPNRNCGRHIEHFNCKKRNVRVSDVTGWSEGKRVAANFYGRENIREFGLSAYDAVLHASRLPGFRKKRVANTF
jgi:hypothetical protein